jgi:tRNA (cytidine/uridine-2'-O-)-methyltransferase
MLTLKTENFADAEASDTIPRPVDRVRLAGLIASPPSDANGQIDTLVRRAPLGLTGAIMRLCLYEPEIAQNVGAVLRLGACLGVDVDLIEPMGFEWDDRRVRRTAMDYIDHVRVARHRNFQDFLGAVPDSRRILLTTKGEVSVYDFAFEAGDILIFGKESAGVPAEVAADCHARLRIPLRECVRSFNLATSAALALGEALRQTRGLPR